MRGFWIPLITTVTYREPKEKKIPQKAEISEINATLLSKELKSAGPTSFEKFMKQIRLLSTMPDKDAHHRLCRPARRH
jgi:hypothetical protein